VARIVANTAGITMALDGFLTMQGPGPKTTTPNPFSSVGDPESLPPNLDLDRALVMYIYQVIFSKKMSLTSFSKTCHDIDSM
jgi:hypothetical protein